MIKIIESTLIQKLDFNLNNNSFSIKREDLIPEAFGGNKVRIALQYFKDMVEKGNNAIISYGSEASNLNRVIAMMSTKLNIKCYVIISRDNESTESRTNNIKLIEMTNAEIVYCNKKNVSEIVENTINISKENGESPYYIYGNKHGIGNELTGVEAYVDAYNEIITYEKNNKNFDYIFVTVGTGTTYSGLFIGKSINKKKHKIIGISIARSESHLKGSISDTIKKYYHNNKLKLYHNEFQDLYIKNYFINLGYSESSDLAQSLSLEMFKHENIFLDSIYTAKGFYGMKNYILENDISSSNILFIHTGSLPLFFDGIN